MTRTARFRIGVIGAATVLALVACQPAKPASPPPPLPGQYLAYYTLSDDGGISRFAAPFSRPVFGGGNATASVAADGSVGATITGLVGNHVARVGFWVAPVRLGDITTIQVSATLTGQDGQQVALFLDVDGNGDSGIWDSGGMFTSLGSDVAAGGDLTMDSSVTINDATVFEVNGGSNLDRTLGELKAGQEPGVGPNTPVFIAVQLFEREPPADASALFTSLLLNGVEVLVP